jgi:predicted metal-dependent hydrolase
MSYGLAALGLFPGIIDVGGIAYTRAVKDGYGSLTIDGLTLRTRVVRKRVRNVNVRLVGDELRVSAPHRVPRGELDDIVHQLARRLVRRARAEEVNADDLAMTIARRVAARFPDPPAITDVRFVTNQTARWGSYSPATGMVRLSAALRVMPPWVLEAVTAHELAHAFHADHSPAFWKLLRRVCPTTDRANAFLDGVSWIARRWPDLPPVERAQLAGPDRDEERMDRGARGPAIGKGKPEHPVDRALPFDLD